MKHNITVDGLAYRLRPVTVEDAQTIVDIRLEDAERNKFIHPISPDPAEQVKWIERYYECEGDYYFAAENLFTGEVEGLGRVVLGEDNKGSWNSLIVRKGSFATPELVKLLLQVAFEIFKLDELEGGFLTDNSAAATLNDSLGAIRRPIEKSALGDGKVYDSVHNYITRELYETVSKPRLEKSIQGVYRMVKKRNLADKNPSIGGC